MPSYAQLCLVLGTGSCTHQWPCVPGDIVSWFIRSWERLLAMPCLGDRFLHSPVALYTRRYCILVYSVLERLLAMPSYAQLCPAMPYLGNRFLHLPVALRTQQCCILVCSVLGEVISYTLTMPCLGNRFLHSPVTLCTRRYCILVYSVQGEVISYTQLCLA